MIIDGSPLDVRGGVECVFKLKLAENYFWLTEEKVNIEPWGATTGYWIQIVVQSTD